MSSRYLLNESNNEVEAGVNSLPGYEHKQFSNHHRYQKLVEAAAFYWDNMEELRRRWHRADDFMMGRQLNDLVTYNGQTMTIKRYMEMKGMPALSNDVISDKMLTLIGLVREQHTTAVFKPVDSAEEMPCAILNEMVRQNDNNNFRQEMDARQFEKFLTFGFVCYKTVWDFREGREDVWNETPDIFKLALPPFSKPDLSDVEFIAEAHDISWGEMLEAFGGGRESNDAILRRIYTAANSLAYREQGYNSTGLHQLNTLDDFYHSNIIGRYRVIEIWTRERRQALWCHDRLRADVGFRPLSDKADIEAENERRREENIVKDEYGTPLLDVEGELQYYVDPDDLQLIEYEVRIESFWYQRFISPNGYLLYEGISPYVVKRGGYNHYYHPYTFLAYPCLQGEVRSPVMRLIDKQRALNHYHILTEFVIANGAKGAMAIDENALTDSMSIDEIAENYVKTDGIILYNSKNGGNPPTAIQNKSMPAGLEFLVQYTKQFTTDQSGVQGALQGVHRNTSGKQYQIEKQSASTTVSDFLESFNGCKLREAKKKLWTVQCFYDEHRSIQLTGEDFRSYYDPYTMGDIDMDVAMDLDVHSATVRDKIDDLLWQLKGMGDINALEMLESGGFPGTERLKKVLRKKLEEAEQAAAQAQAAGLPPAMAGGGAPPVVQQAPTHLKDEQPAGIT